MLRQRKPPPPPSGEATPRNDVQGENPAPGLIGIVIALLVAGVVLWVITPREKLFTPQVLLKYDGTKDDVPIYLAILGSVFDVTKGGQYYGPNGPYRHFSGRDASRAFVSGNFTGDGLTDSVDGLSPLELKSIGDWRSFYFKSYSYLGKLIGTYYDAHGAATDTLVQVEEAIKRGLELSREKEAMEKMYPTCDSRWSQNEGGEVWCPSGYPRKVSVSPVLPSQGRGEIRCACFDNEHLNEPGLELYNGCEPTASICRT